MKRNFKLLVAVVVLATLVMTLASCDVINGIIDKINPNKPCEHQYTNTVTKEATCTEAGEMTLTCSICGDTKTEPIAPGHTEVELEGKAPTCTEAGLSKGKKCSVCDTIITEQVTINAAGHKYVEGVCSACGDVDEDYGKTFFSATTTDNNCWVDKITFTATGEGEYTFYLPVGLGAWDAEGCDNFTNAPFVDPYNFREYDPEGEHKFTVGLEANETYEFYISAEEKKDWQIAWTYNACDVEDDTPAGGEGGNDNVVLDGVYTGHAMYQNNITVTFNPMLGVVTFAQGDNSLMCLYEVKDGAVVLYKNDGSGEEWNSMFYAIALENGVPVAATYNGNNFTLVVGADSGDGDDDDQTTDPLDTENSELAIGDNTINVTDADLEAEAIEYTIVVTAEGTFAFSSNDLAAIVYDANGMQVGRGSAYLTKGTYTVSVVTAYLSTAGEFTLTVEYTAPSTDEEADGSESNPYVWETLPESITINSDTINMVYYLFTATQAGNITITWPTADSWANWFEMDGTNTTATNGTSNEQTTMVVPVEAGKTYRIGLGTYYVAGEVTLTVAFGEGTTEEDKGTTYVGTDDWGNSPLTVVITDTTVTFNYNHPMTGPSSATYTYAMVDGAMVLYNEDGSTVNPLGGLVNVDENGTPVSAAYNGTDYTLALAGADDGDDNTGSGDDNTGDDDSEEIVTSGTIYDGEANSVTISADDIEAGKVYLSFMAYQTGEYEFSSNDLYISAVYTENGTLIEMNDNYCYELQEYTSYIVEINSNYLYSAGTYSVTPEYQYPLGHMNNPDWYYTIGETVTATCPGGYDAVWYQFYANETGTLTLSTEADGITLMLAGHPGYEIDNISYDDNYNAVYAKSLSLDVVKGRKYYLALAASSSETTVEVEFTVSITAGDIETNGTVNVPHNIVVGTNTVSLNSWDSAWFMYQATENGTLTLSTTSTSYGWYAIDAFGSDALATTGDITWKVEIGDIVYLFLENQGANGELSFTASFKADPTEALFEGTLITDGSAANEIVISENTYAGFQVSGTAGQFTITWDNTNAVVKVNEEVIENGDIISVANPYWGPYFQISLPEYAAGTVNITITPYEAPSQEAVAGDNTVSANGSTATPVKFTATEANTYVITPGTNAVVEYDYMSYFAGETIKVTLGAGEFVKFNVYTEDRSEADVVVNIAVAAPSVSGEYRYVDSEDWKHRWVLILEDDGTGTIAEQNYDSVTLTWNDASYNLLTYTFVKGETNYSITIDFADGCSAVDGTYVTGPVDDTTGITSVVIGESTFDFFLYE